MSGIIGVSPDMKSGLVGKYPAGHVVQVYSTNTAFGGSSHELNATNTSDQDADGDGETITGVTAGNLLIATVWGGFAYYYGGVANYVYYRIGFSPNTGSDSFFESEAYYTRSTDGFVYQCAPSITSRYIVPSGVTSVEVLRLVSTPVANLTGVWQSPGGGAYCGCVIMEVQQ